jgi:hypothetical protein
MPWSFLQKLQQAEPASFLIAMSEKEARLFFSKRKNNYYKTNP